MSPNADRTVHWMERVARSAALPRADALRIAADTSTEEAWSCAVATCGVDEERIAAAAAACFRLPLADLSRAEPTAAKLVPGKLARKFGVLPLADEDRFLVVATAHPANIEAEQELGFASGRRPKLAIAPPSAIAEALERTYPAESTAASLLSRLASQVAAIQVDGGDDATGATERASGPIARLTDLILHEAVRRKASDVHLQPTTSGAIVRLRVDGVLHTAMQMPSSVLVRVISRIKVMSRLDIADRTRPQDGRTRIAVSGKRYDLRVSTVPIRQVEKAVVRILDPEGAGTLDDTGIEAAQLQRIRHTLRHRDGIFLVTGPTGSGKTTTLYGALREIATEDLNIMTVEDPVEYVLEGTTQIQVDTKQGMTFASSLRAILRQDPDVIFVGEIRDRETAEVAAHASLTGHLVLATLHTNDAVGSVRRLVDLGLSPATVTEVLRGALAQRLLRKVCPYCSVSLTDKPLNAHEQSLRASYGVTPLARADGCDRCSGQGYLGRLPLTELMLTTPALNSLILEGAAAVKLHEQAAKDGMRTLLESALDRVRAGETTLEEVQRVLGDSEQEPNGTSAQTEGQPASRPTSLTPPPPPRAATAHEHDEDTIQVLVVDDDGTNRTIVRALLEKEGYRVTEASDGSEGLAHLAKGETFALMVLDLDMPLLGGREVLRAVRSSLRTSGLPVVVLTGSPDPEAEIDLIEAGADDYIRKPLEPSRFLTRVRAVLRRATV